MGSETKSDGTDAAQAEPTAPRRTAEPHDPKPAASGGAAPADGVGVPQVRPSWGDLARARPFAVGSWVLLLSSMAVAVITGNIGPALGLLGAAVVLNVLDKRAHPAARD